MKSVIKELTGNLDTFGRFWLYLGLGSLAAAAAMSFDFGWGVSFKHAIFLAILSAVAAFGPMAAEMLWSKGRKAVSIATAIICVPLLTIEFYSHAGYTAGLRGSNIETAVVQNTVYDGAQDNVKEAKTSREFWVKRRDELRSANPWAAKTTADAKTAEVANMEGDKVFARSKQCKQVTLPESRNFCDKLTGLRAELAVIAELNKAAEQIEASDRVLKLDREKAALIEHKSSAVAHQNTSLKKWVSLAFNGGAKASEFQSEAAEQSANLAMAIAGTGLPAFALFVAGLFRRPEDDREPQHKPVDMMGHFLTAIRESGHKALPA